MRVWALVAFVALGASCKKTSATDPPEPREHAIGAYGEPPAASCKKDDDCAVRRLEQCCPAPCEDKELFAVAKNDTYDRGCSKEGSCAQATSNPRCVGAPRAADYAAVCREGVCAKELRFDARALACENDADCALTGRPLDDLCTCCPMIPRAITSAGLRRENEDVETFCRPCGANVNCPATKPTAPSTAKCVAKRCTVVTR